MKNVAHIYIDEKYDGYLLNVKDESEVRSWLYNHGKTKDHPDDQPRDNIRIIIEEGDATL